MKIIIEDVEHGGRLNPQKGRGEVEPTRHLCGPSLKERVDYTRERVTLSGPREYEIGDELGAAALELREVEGIVGVVGGGEAAVVAVGEGEEGEAGDGGLIGHAAVHVEGGGESDTCT